MLSRVNRDQVLAQYKGRLVPANHPASKTVRNVVDRILSAIRNDPKLAALLPSGEEWHVHLVNDPNTANAFVLPGEIFVFTGILLPAQSEAGLAVVLGHEIAHALARHGAEKISFYQLVSVSMTIGRIVAVAFGGGDWWPSGYFEGFLGNLLLLLPFSRKCEKEADYIGLLLLADAGYDPQEAPRFWARMQEFVKRQKSGEPPAFLSTHPSHAERTQELQRWMPEALARYERALEAT